MRAAKAGIAIPLPHSEPCTCARFEARLEALEREVAQLPKFGSWRNSPPDAARILAGLAHTFGSACFSAGDIARMAAHPELKPFRGMSVRRVGAVLRMLHRVSLRNSTVTTYRLERIGRDGRGALWHVCPQDKHSRAGAHAVSPAP